MAEPTHILVVDDSPTQVRQIQMVLENDGFTVQTAHDGQEAMQCIEADQPLLVVTDLQMPNMSGLELVAAVRNHSPSLPVILTTSQGSESIAAQALQEGAQVTFRNVTSPLHSLPSCDKSFPSIRPQDPSAKCAICNQELDLTFS